MKSNSSKRPGVSAAGWFYSHPGFHSPARMVPSGPEPIKALSRLTGIDVMEHSHPTGFYSAACLSCRLEGK